MTACICRATRLVNIRGSEQRNQAGLSPLRAARGQNRRPVIAQAPGDDGQMAEVPLWPVWGVTAKVLEILGRAVC